MFALKNDPAAQKANNDISDSELRKILREEMRQAQRMQKTSLRQGDLSRFYQ